jgi:hypothetical protein
MSRRRKSLIAFAVVLGAVMLVPMLRHYQLKADVARYRAELKAQGEPMDLAQVIPPSVPPGQNSAALFTNAVSLLGTNKNVLWSNLPPAMRMVAPGKAMIGWQQPDVREAIKNGASNSWEEIGAALAEERTGLDLLRQLPAEPVFDFRLNYGDGAGHIKITHLAPAKRAVQRLAASVAMSLRRGDLEMATKDIQAMLSVAHGLSHDRTLISELVRDAIAQIALAANWELLQSTNLTDGQLATLQRGWTDLEFCQQFGNSMAMERAGGKIELDAMRGSNLESLYGPLKQLGLVDGEDSFCENLKVRYKCVMWRYWWSYPDELRYLKGTHATIEAAREAETNHSFFAAKAELEKRINALAVKTDDDDVSLFTDPSKADLHFVISSTVKAFQRAFDKVVNVEVARQLTVTAIGLKRFQLQHGSYPDKLSELTPEFFASIPPDPLDGQPLRYRRNADGSFLLYSIGDDGRDDGGDPRPPEGSHSRQWQSGRDWVWPQPATAAEVEAYYKEQAK